MIAQAPIIIEALRGNERTGHVESVHAVDAVISDSAGQIIASYGDSERGVFPRSAIKLLQALPLVESGAADAYGYDDKHLALSCASHNGEAFQTDAVKEMLSAANLSPACLECGTQLPKHQSDIDLLVRQGVAVTALHNNCSGKHAGFLAFAQHTGLETKNYIKFGSPVMNEIALTLSQVTGEPHGEENYGIDGCSIPTYEIRLDKLAHAYARVAAGAGGSIIRSNAMRRLAKACMKHSEFVAGSDRFDTGLMTVMKGRVLTKTGAEGVFTIVIPELGLGAALKCRDGRTRAAEVACAHLIESMFQQADSSFEEAQVNTLKKLANPVLKNWNRLVVGSLRVRQ